MSGQGKIRGGSDIPSFAPFDSEGNLTVVVETPKGSRNNYSFDEKHRAFQLKKVLPEGMVFPHDFGFVPSTRPGDGDRLDVLVLMDYQAFPGCIVQSRILGVIEGEQQEDGHKIRNDRLVAVACASHTHSDLRHIDDLNGTFLEQVQTLFEAYHAQGGSRYKTLGYKGPKRALQMVKQSVVSKRHTKKK